MGYNFVAENCRICISNRYFSMPTLRVSIDASDAYLEALQDDTQSFQTNKKVSFLVPMPSSKNDHNQSLFGNYAATKTTFGFWTSSRPSKCLKNDSNSLFYNIVNGTKILTFKHLGCKSVNQSKIM